MIFLLSNNGSMWIIWVIFLTCILIGFLRYRLFEGTKSTKWAEDYGWAKISAESNTKIDLCWWTCEIQYKICKYVQIHFCEEILGFKLVIYFFGPEILKFFFSFMSNFASERRIVLLKKHGNYKGIISLLVL